MGYFQDMYINSLHYPKLGSKDVLVHIEPEDATIDGLKNEENELNAKLEELECQLRRRENQIKDMQRKTEEKIGNLEK